MGKTPVDEEKEQGQIEGTVIAKSCFRDGRLPGWASPSPASVVEQQGLDQEFPNFRVLRPLDTLKNYLTYQRIFVSVSHFYLYLLDLKLKMGNLEGCIYYWI